MFVKPVVREDVPVKEDAVAETLLFLSTFDICVAIDFYRIFVSSDTLQRIDSLGDLVQ